jgi:predicted cupin superfamily sugar epimerase
VNAPPRRPALDGLSALEVASALDLRPHREGGYFRETYRSPVVVPTPLGPRSLCTAILYLLTAGDPSRFHRLRFDEVWFFHAGAPAELVFLEPFEMRVLGDDAPQFVVPGRRWMAARVAAGAQPGPGDGLSPGPADWTLAGCVVSPGFEYEDFEPGDRAGLLRAYPEAAELVRVLT